MGTAVMMYVLPMMLGQTYDLGKEKPGLQIYPLNIEDSAVKIEHYFTDAQYRMIENAEQIKDFLDISGKLSLKVKGGMVDISGEGQYLKDSSSKTNGMEILVKVHFETVTKTIPTSKLPTKGWDNYAKDYLGTHYCRSITYGGDLIASIRITASNNYDLLRIKGAVNGGINAGGGSFEANVKGKLEILKKNAQDSSSMEINYYASVPIHGVSYDIDGLMKLIENFPDHVKKVNNGLGNPLRMELFPINSLKQTYPAYFENRALTDQIEDMESQFDDLRETRRRLGIWTSSLPPMIPQDIDTKISTFSDRVNEIYGVYMKSIGDLDVAEGASTKPITDAFDAYKAGDYIMPQKYIRELVTMQREIYDGHPELRPRIGGAQYIRWGVSECSASETETVISGVVTASEYGNQGGSSEFVCSRVDPVQVEPSNYFSGYPGDDDPDDHLLVSPLRYRGELKKFESMRDKRIACAQCRAALRTTVLVKMAAKSCPTDKWTKEYEGILMAPGMHTSKGQFVCVDVEMKEPEGKALFGDSTDSSIAEIQEVTVECGSLPCGPYAADKPIPCVVCTL